MLMNGRRFSQIDRIPFVIDFPRRELHKMIREMVKIAEAHRTDNAINSSFPPLCIIKYIATNSTMIATSLMDKTGMKRPVAIHQFVDGVASPRKKRLANRYFPEGIAPPKFGSRNATTTGK